MDLDLKDRKILYELDKNARQSDAKIAKNVGLSRDSVRYRINSLVQQEHIHYFMTLLNSMKLGYEWYRTFFKFQNISLAKEKEIIAYLQERVSWITKVEGMWDINTGIFVKNVYEYRDFINAFLLKFNHYIERYEVSIVTREWTYKKEYLLNNKVNTMKPLLMGFDNQKEYQHERIDEIDYNILKIILKNARMKSIDIAKKTGTTEMVVRYRIKKLIEKEIIIGFKPFLNLQKLGYIYFKLHLRLQNFTPEKKKSIVTYIHQHPNTVHMTELVGGADLETEFQVRTNEEFYHHVENLRLNFGDIIRDYHFMQYTQEFKFTYLPELFS